MLVLARGKKDICDYLFILSSESYLAIFLCVLKAYLITKQQKASFFYKKFIYQGVLLLSCLSVRFPCLFLFLF